MGFGRNGDFDGDGLTDQVAWNPTNGEWWTVFSTGDNGIAQYSGIWSKFANWQYVDVGDVDGDARDELIGRASDGQWWVGFFQDNGTIKNNLVGQWYEGAGWRSVSIADLDGDGRDEIVGRTSGGYWWSSSYYHGQTLLTKSLGQWNENAAWRDVLVGDVTGDGRADIVGRTSDGLWYRSVLSATTNQLNSVAWGRWYEGANWKDVKLADLDGNGAEEVVGRTSGGEWWATGFTSAGFSSRKVGFWSTAFTWNDVQVYDVDENGREDIVGRTNTGAWWAAMTQTTGVTSNVRMGSWSTAINWRFVHVGKTKAEFDEIAGGGEDTLSGTLLIRAHRSDTIVTVTDDSILTGFVNVTVKYNKNGTEIVKGGTYLTALVDSIEFRGNVGHDNFKVTTNYAIPVVARGGIGNDRLESDAGVSKLFGDSGNDTMINLNYNADNGDVMDGGKGANQFNIGFGLTNTVNYAANALAWAVNNSGNTDPTAAYYRDIMQGYYGNCYFWAALAAASDAGVDLVSQATTSIVGGVRTFSSTGRIAYDANIDSYFVRLYVLNSAGNVSNDWREVKFDWRTGFTNPGKPNDESSFYGDPIIRPQNATTAENDFWHVLYWRAWNPKYQENEGGDSAKVLPNLTGSLNVTGEYSKFILDTAASENAAKQAIINASNAGHAVVAGTLGDFATAKIEAEKPPLDHKGQIGETNRYGQIYAAHAYTIINADTTYVYLYNPWGADGYKKFFDTNTDTTTKDSWIFDSERATELQRSRGLWY